MSLPDEMKRMRIAAPSGPDKTLPDERPQGGRRAVFIDRDGVINEDMINLGDHRGVRILPGVKEGMLRIRSMGYLIVIVTNQGGIGYGLLTVEDFTNVMASIAGNLGDILWDRVYFSPYHERARIDRYRGDHPDRKPNPGMIIRAAEEMDIDLSGSWMIGDHLKDMEAGNRSGCRTILVSTGRGKKEIASLLKGGSREIRRPDFITQDLDYASKAIEVSDHEGNDT